MIRRICNWTNLAAVILSWNLTADAAPIPAVTFGSVDAWDSWRDDIVGWRFTIAGPTDIRVTDLGFYDRGSDGLLVEHPVGIYHVDSEALVASATVPSGASATLRSGFRFMPVAPTTLGAGETYVILAYRPRITPNDPVASRATVLSTAPFVNFETEIAANVPGGLRFINSPYGGSPSEYNDAWFGPNFRAELVFADFDKDGDVDGDDFLIWQANFGIESGASSNTGDTDRDGDVDGDDFLAWQQEYESGGGAEISTPEPSAMVLLSAAIGLGLLSRRF